MSKRLVQAAALICVLLLAGGCGKKGRLYIPQDSSAGVPPVASAVSARADPAFA